MIKSLSPDLVYLATGPTDLRKSIDGLSILVQEAFELNPFSNSLFVFCNRNQDKVKILHWEHNGFWLYYRRLEKGRFKWPGAKKSIWSDIIKFQSQTAREKGYYRKKTAFINFCSQFAPAGWYKKYTETPITDAILDRINHDSYTVRLEPTVGYHGSFNWYIYHIHLINHQLALWKTQQKY